MALSPIPLVGEAYALASTPAAQHRVLNLFAEQLPENARGKFYLKNTPGLVQAATVGTGPINAMAGSHGSLFVASGYRAYRITEIAGVLATVLDMGPIGSVPADIDNTSHTTIAIGLAGAVIVSAPRAYVAGFTDTVLRPIATGGGNFPAEGTSSVCYLDGYYVFTVFGGEYFFTSDLLSPSSYSGLSFVKLSSQLDFVEHCMAHNGELWLFGQQTVSVWYNSGDPVTPFVPRTGAVIQTGCGAYKSVCELDGSLWWLGTDGVVYRSSGYQAKRVSTHAIEEHLAGYSVLGFQTVRACAFVHEGHEFYALHLTQINRTFVYDCATGLWHERSSVGLDAGRWNINAATKTAAKWVLGDSITGQIWVMDRGTGTEKGIAVQRMAQLPALVTHGPRAFMSRLEVEMQTGIGGISTPIQVSWSDDGGYTYTTPRALPTGTPGQMRKRVFTTRLGSFRQRVLRLLGVGQMAIYGVDADVGAGDA